MHPATADAIVATLAREQVVPADVIAASKKEKPGLFGDRVFSYK
jgi:hypothetical protein